MSIPLPIGLKIVQTARLGVFQAPQDRLVSQELGLNSATDGLFSAYRVKADGCWSVADLPDQSDAWFTLVYVLDGSLTLRLDDSSVTLQAHDAVAQVPLTDANLLARSTRLEFLTIQVPDTARAHELLTFRSLPAISLDAPDTHVKGQGPRDYFDYRDLGLAQTTNRQIEVQIVRAQRARQGGTGWHCHSMAQLSYGLSGWASLGVQGVPGRVMQEPGDALSIPAGCVHNAESFSDDYWALQLQIPPDYETTPAPSPE
jgi:quercetin dioxygenase-like cupin family protein